MAAVLIDVYSAFAVAFVAYSGHSVMLLVDTTNHK